MIKNLLSTIILFLFWGFTCMAQETVERNRKLTPEVNEVYQVLKTDYTVMQGAYAAYLKKALIAAGHYDKNKKTGTWTFFNRQGKVSERFNYDTQNLVYEGPDSGSKITYVVDDSLKNNPRFTRPVRIGGTYYGYLPYLNLIKLPADLSNLNNETDRAFIELLVSPYGRLAECKLRITPVRGQNPQDDLILNFNINLLSDEDKIFIPATLNDQAISVRIIIPASFYKADRVRF